jgi:hypothetical protein
MQEVTDMLQKSKLLVVKTDLFIVDRTEESLKYTLPFDIVFLHVPVNFLRKLVGYQDKVLNDYKKRF